MEVRLHISIIGIDIGPTRKLLTAPLHNSPKLTFSRKFFSQFKQETIFIGMRVN